MSGTLIFFEEEIMSAILYIGLVSLSLIWGFSFFFIKVLVGYFSPFAVVFFRSFMGAGIVFLIILFSKKKFLPEKRQNWGIILFVALFNTVFPWSLISFSERLISSSLASVLNATTPIWTIIVGILFFKSRIKPIQWWGIIIGFSGIIVLLDLQFDQLLTGNFLAYLGMLLAAFFYGIASQFSRNYLKEMDVYRLAFFTLIISSSVSGILVLLSGGIDFKYIGEPMVLISIIGLGCFGSGIAYMIYYFLIKEGSAEFASLVTYLVPVTAIFWGMLILDEKIELRMIIGLISILFGVFISSRIESKKNIENKKSMNLN